MKALLIGLGQIGLGLVVPVFKKAGYTLTGTDASRDRINALRNGYFLQTPSGVEKIDVDVVSMDEVADEFEVIITSVGRQHLEKVAAWCREKHFSVPVLLAENLPDTVNHFPRQIPIVVDRICPRIVTRDGCLSAVAEDYYKIVVVDDPITRQLGVVNCVELIATEEEVEQRRKQKMFTVNTSHVLTALFGQQLGCLLVEEAIARSEVSTRIRSMVSEVAPWLGFDSKDAEQRASEIIRRFGSPVQDSLSRIFGSVNRKSALRYVEVPLNGVRSVGAAAPTLEEARELLNS
ncbi:MAG: hypothetical protein HYT37_00740 [Candidatus Sungbacteria bacterium]|nr:hypothetical protein [Candidatus Sungbacteria bacterium]